VSAGAGDGITVRGTGPGDERFAAAASALIRSVAERYDIALRSEEWLAKKIVGGRAAVALYGDELVGFGYWSSWEDERFVSHSGLVVRADQRGHGVGKRLKRVLFESTRRALPSARIMSLTTSPQVIAMNGALGFELVPLERLTKDEAFWDGCRTCRNYADVRARGERCCCLGMLYEPPEARADGG
jgi:GNAT superfamily N-acetyltransferase